MAMHSPPHPGAFIKATYLEPFDLSIRFLAQQLDVAPSTINRLINEESGVSSEMAYRLSGTLGRSPESWLTMQARYDLSHTKKPIVSNIDFDDLSDAA